MSRSWQGQSGDNTLGATAVAVIARQLRCVLRGGAWRKTIPERRRRPRGLTARPSGQFMHRKSQKKASATL
jgi:hypothetical protein